VDWLAAYAAAVATGGFLWQVYLWRQKRRRDLVVDVRHELSRHGGESVELFSDVEPGEGDFLDLLGQRSPLRYELRVVVTNRGESPEFIDFVGLRAVNGSAPIVFDPPDEKALPAARSMEKRFFAENLPALPPAFVGFARIGEQVIESTPQKLDENLLRTREQAE
jgi:hypothetical protein